MKTTRPTKKKLALLALPLIMGLGIIGSEVASAATMVTNTPTASVTITTTNGAIIGTNTSTLGIWTTNAGTTNFATGGVGFNSTNWASAASGSNYGVVFTTNGSIALTNNIYLNALQYSPASSGTLIVGTTNTNAYVGVTNTNSSMLQGTLNFVGPNSFLTVPTGSGTLQLNTKLVVATNMAVTNNANLVITNQIVVNASQTLTLGGSGTTSFTGAASPLANNGYLIITNEYVRFTNNGGYTLPLGNSLIANAVVNGGGSGNGFAPGANSTVTVTTGGVLTNTFYKDNAQNNMTLILTNGGSMYLGGGYVSMGRNSTNEKILIGSSIGSQTSTLNGNAQAIAIGYYSVTTNDLILVSSNGLITNFAGFKLGGSSATSVSNSYNQVILTNGGVAASVNTAGNASYIGFSTNDNSNSLIITGPGSLYNANTNGFYVGYNATNGASNYGNSLQVANGGVLTNTTFISVDNSNSYVSISGGTVYANSVLFSNSTASLILSNNGITNGALIANANGNLISGSGTVTIAGNGEIDAGGFVVTNSASVTGSGTLTVNGNANGNLGTGSLTLSGSNSFGGLTVAGGTLVAGSSNALGAGTAAVNAGKLNVASTGVTNQISVNGGTVNFSGAGTNNSSGNVTLNTGGSLTVGSGGGNALTLGNLTLNGGTLNLAVSNGLTSDLITTASFGITANSYVTLTGFGSGNSYTILSNASGINLGSYSLIGTNMGHNVANFALDDTGTTITANITTVATKWNGASSNWSAGWDTYVPTLAGDVAVLDATGAGNSSILVDTSAVVGSLTFSNAAGYSIGTLVSSNLTLNNGNNVSTVTVQAGNHTIAEGTAIANGVVFNETDGSSLTMAGGITGSGGLTQGGQGTLVLGGSNSYSGGVTLNGGTVVAGNASALGTNNNALNVASGTLNNGAYNISAGAVTLGNGTISGTGTLTGTSYKATNSGNALITQGLAGSAGFTNAGTGTTTLAGTNTFSGATVVNGGSTLIVSGLLGNGSYASAITLNTSTLNLAESGAQTLSGAISGSGTLVNSGSGTTTLGANFSYANMVVSNSGNLTATNQFYMNGGTNAGSVGSVFNNSGTFNSTLSGQFRMQGGTNTMNLLAGTATFNGFNEGSSAGTNLITVYSGATLRLTNSPSIGYSGSVGSNVVVVNPGAVFNQTTGTMYINQAMSSGYAAVTNYGTITMSGNQITMNAQNGTNNTAVLAQAGGTFINATNMYIGGGGAATPLALSNSTTLVDVSGGILSNGGSIYLGWQGNSMSNTLTVEGTGTATVGGSLYLGSGIALYGNSTSANNGGTLYSNTSYLTTIGGQTWPVYVTQYFTNTSSLTNAIAVSTNAYVMTNNNTVNLLTGGTLVVKGGISAGGYSIGTNGVATATGIAGGMYAFNWNGGTLQAASNSTTFFTNSPYTTVTLGTAGGTFNAAGYNDTISQVLGGAGILRVTNSTGSGTLTLSGANTYQGGTYINGGTLAVANNSALGAGDVANNATLAYTNSGNVTLGNNITGTGVVAVGSTGTLTLTGNNSYSGGTLINSGALAFTHGGALGAGTVTDNASLVYTGSGSQTANFSNAVSGTGVLNLSGSGTLTLTGNNAVSVPTAVNSGTLQVSGSLTSSAVTVNSGATLSGTGTLGATTLAAGSTLTSGGADGVTSGTLSFSSLVINGGSFLWNLQTKTNGLTDAYDQVNVAGVLDLSGLSATNTFTIVLNTNATTVWDNTIRSAQPFTLFTAGTLNQFDPSKFSLPNIDPSVGGFNIGTNNNSVVLYYTAAGDPVFVRVEGGQSTNLAGADRYGSVLGLPASAIYTPVIKGGNGELVLDGLDSDGGVLPANFGGKLTIGSGTVTVATNAGAFGQMAGISIGSTNAEFTGSNAVLNINATGFSTGLGIRVSGTGTSSLVNSSGGNATFYGSLSLETNLVISSTSSSGGLLLSGIVSGQGALLASGSGTIALTAPNSYAGGTVVNGSTLVAGSPTALGSGTLSVLSPSVLQAGAANLTVGNGVSVTNGSKLTLDSAGNNFAETGAISGNGAVGITNSTGSGTVTLSGASSYAGGTTVNGGVLNVTTNTALGTGAVTVNAGTLRQGVSNALSVPVVARGNGSLDLNNFTFTVNATNLSGTGILNVLNNSKTTVSDVSPFAGTLNFGSGTISVATNGSLANATVSISGLGTVLTNFGTMGSVYVGGNGSNNVGTYGSAGLVNLYAASNSTFTGTVTIAGPDAGKSAWAQLLHPNTNVYTSTFYGVMGSPTISVSSTLGMKVGDSFLGNGPGFNNTPNTFIVAIDTNNNLVTLATNLAYTTTLTNVCTVAEKTPGTNYGYASFGSGVTVTNLIVNGRLDLTGTNAQFLSGITGTPNMITNYVGGGAGIIVNNSTYGGSNNLGGTGSILNFQAGGAFAGYYFMSSKTSQTLTQSGTGTTYFGVFGQTATYGTFNTNNQTTLSGGNWAIGQLGQNNTGAGYTTAGTFTITNGANVTIGGNYGAGAEYYDHGNWNIASGSMTFLGPVTESGGGGSGVNPLNFTVGSSGTLSLQTTNGYLYYMRLGVGVATNAPYPSSLTLNGGLVTLSGLYLGNDIAAGVSNDVISAAVNSGTFNNFGDTIVGMNASTGIAKNISSMLTLNGGKFLTGGSLDASVPTLLSNSSVTNSFVWNGGQLSPYRVLATNTNWNGTGSSIIGGTLYNTNSGTLAPGDVGVAGVTTIAGNYVQTGTHAVLALDLTGVTAANAFTNGATNGGSYDTVNVTGSAVFSNTTIALNQNWYALGNGASNQFTLVGGSTNLVLNNVNFTWAGGASGSTIVSPDNAIAITIGHNSNNLVANLSVNQWVNGQGNWGSGGTNVWNRSVDTTNGAYSFAAFGSNASAVLDQNETVHALSFLGGNGSLSSLNGAGITLASADGNGVILNNATGTNTISAPITLQDNLTVIGNGSLTLSGNISGSYGLIVAGYNTATTTNAVALSGSNSYAGGTILTSGTLKGGNANAFGTGAITVAGGTLDLGGNTITNTLATVTGGVLTNGTIVNNGGSYAFSNAGTVTVAASLAGNNSLVASGTGLTALLGVNTYSGPTYLTNGSLQTAFNSNTVITVAPGANLIAVINDANGFGWSEANLVSQAAGMSNATLSFDGSGAGYTVSTNIFVNGSSSLTLGTYGTGTVSLVSGGNYQNSRFLVNGGTLDLGGNTIALSNNGLTITSGNLTDGTVTSSGNQVTNAAYYYFNYFGIPSNAVTTNSYTVTANAQQGTSTVSATLGGFLGLTVNNGTNGTLALTGTNTYVGPTIVNSGSLWTTLNTNTVITVGASGNLIVPVGNANTGSNSWTDAAIANQAAGMGNSATLSLDVTGTNYLLQQNGLTNNTITTNPVTLVTATNTNQSVTLSTYGGAGTLTLASSSTYAGISTLQLNNNAGTLDLGGNTLTLTNKGVDINAFSGTMSNGTVIGSGTFRNFVYGSNVTTIAANLGGSASFVKGADGTTYLSGSNTFTGGLTLTNVNTVNPGVYGTLVAVTPTALGNGPIAIAGGTLDLGSNIITGTSTFSMSGGTITNGTLTEALYNLSGGTVAGNLGGGVANVLLGAVNVTGSLGSSAVNIYDFGTLRLGSSNALSGGVAVTMGAPNEVWTINTLDLGGNSTSLGSLQTLGTGLNQVIDSVGGSTLTLPGGTLFNGSLGGTGTSNNAFALNITSGTVTLGASNSYSGGTVVNGGSLVVGNGNALGSGTLTVNGGSVDLGNLTVAPGGTVLGNGTISNGTLASSIRFNGTSGSVLSAVVADGTTPSSVTVNGPGTLTLGAVNSYTGGTVVNGGRLIVGNAGSLGSGPVAVAAGTLDLGANSITNANTFTMSGGTVTNGSISESVFNLSGGNVGSTLTGPVANVSGAVFVSGSIQTASVNVTKGGTLTAGSDNALTSASQVTFGSAGESASVNSLDLAGHNLSVGGLNTAGSAASQIIDTVGGSTLNLTGASSFAGSIGPVGSQNSAISLNVVSGNHQLLGANGYTGATTIGTGAVLDLGATGSLAATPTVTVNGGSLLLGGVNQVNPNADLTLNGGKVSLGGATGSAPTVSQTFASLTLTANSIIDFNGLNGSSFTVTGPMVLDNNSLRVLNWNTSDHLILSLGSAGITDTDLAQITFYADLGNTKLGQMDGGLLLNGNEIVPVPEPSVVVAGLLMVAMMLVAGRRRIAGLLARVS